MKGKIIPYQKLLILTSIFVMLVGFFTERAVLSIGMILFVIAYLLTLDRTDLQTYRNNPFLWMMGLLFILPLISGFWSSDIGRWSNMVQVKAPLLVLPFCSVTLFRFKSWEIRWINLFFICAIIIACGWSLWQYWQIGTVLGEQYLKAKVLPIVATDDHIRFSWAVVIAYTILLQWLIDKYRQAGKTWKLLNILILLIYGVYLHILAAKTGLLGFYLVNIIALFYFFRKRLVILLSCLVTLTALPILSYWLLPTFRNRIKFVVWDFQNYSRGNYVEGLVDAPRIYSFRAGGQIIRDHPLTGVGYGDIVPEAIAWYNREAPFLKPYEMHAPSSEWLMYGCGTGIGGMLVFTLIMIFPFLLSTHCRNYVWICFHLLAAITFIYEPSLNIQYGVFLYAFFAIWFYWTILIEGKAAQK